MTDPVPRPHLFNIVYPDDHRPDLAVHFYAGDILSMSADILVISAYLGSYVPVPGTLFGHLADRYGFFLDPNDPERIADHLWRFSVPTGSRLPFRTLLIVEMDHSQGSPHNIMLRTFDNLRRVMPGAIGANDRTISFILLGTGLQGLPLETSAIELLRLASALTRTPLTEIRIFAYSFEAVALLNTNIDRFLQRPSTGTLVSPLLGALADEMRALPPARIAPIREEVQQFIQLVSVPGLSVVPAARVGRNVAEFFANHLTDRHDVSVEQPPILENRMRALGPILGSDLYPRYVLSYLRLLQSIGNAASHHPPPELVREDILSVGIAIQRLVQILL